MAEVTEMSADGRATRTIAVESEDPERVIAAVRDLGLEAGRSCASPAGSRRSSASARGATP